MSSSSLSAEPHRKTAVETLEEIAELHRDIFHCFLEVEGTFPPVKRFESRLVDVYGRPVEVCSIHPQQHHYCHDRNDPAALRAARHPYSEDPSKAIPFFPEGTDPSLEIAYKKYQMCDFSVATFLGSLESKVQKSIPNAQVDWLEVTFAPARLFSPMQRPTNPFELHQHSAFLVTLPGTDGRYVVDFTIEQFGYDKWILPITEYINFRSSARWVTPDLSEKLDQMAPWLPADHMVCQGIMQDVCAGVDWSALMGMERQERRLAIITQACDHLDADKDQVLRKYLGITQT